MITSFWIFTLNAIRQCAAWASTLITHNIPERRRKARRKQKETYAQSQTRFCAYFRTSRFYPVFFRDRPVRSFRSLTAVTAVLPTLIPRTERSVVGDALHFCCTWYILPGTRYTFCGRCEARCNGDLWAMTIQIYIQKLIAHRLRLPI